MSFRENLQYLRGTRNMTQEQLAMLLGVSRQAISKWESEKAYPEMDKLLMICDLFGVTLDDLVMGDVRRPNSGIRESTADTSTNSGSVGVVAAIAQRNRRLRRKTRRLRCKRITLQRRRVPPQHRALQCRKTWSATTGI